MPLLCRYGCTGNRRRRENECFGCQCIRTCTGQRDRRTPAFHHRYAERDDHRDHDGQFRSLFPEKPARGQVYTRIQISRIQNRNPRSEPGKRENTGNKRRVGRRPDCPGRRSRLGKPERDFAAPGSHPGQCHRLEAI